MPASTQVITDIKSVISTGPSATSAANSIAAAGVIQDLPGNFNLMLNHFADAKRLLADILKDIDGADPILTTLNNINLTLV